MKTGKCKCGNRLFFGNFSCLKCHRLAGRCGQCFALTGFDHADTGETICTACQRPSIPCPNREHLACNSLIAPDTTLCRWCQYTSVMPDLTKPLNKERWVELERAKRRLLLELEALGLPPFVKGLTETHPLTFKFLEDIVGADGAVQKIYTGHENGVIVVNILEADSVHREQVRVALREPQRTLIGHMRHESGHYIDWAYASRAAGDEYSRIFGDPNAVSYDLAIKQHYENGAVSDWPKAYVSAYASMHPWEDFAETVNVYLDIMAIGVTANDQGLTSIDLSPNASASSIVESVLKLAVTVSEFNFDFGLPPLLPERFSPKVHDKLTFVHSLRSDAMIQRLSSALPAEARG
jgi:hypothetical protein